MDALSRLEGHAHVLDDILRTLSYAALLEAEKVSPLWKRMIRHHYVAIWRGYWHNQLVVSTKWKMLSARLEHTQPELFDRMRAGDVSTYRQVCHHIEQNVGQMLECDLKKHRIYQTSSKHLNLKGRMFRVNESSVFIGAHRKVIIVNRWTAEFVKELDMPFSCAIDLKLNESVLAVKLFGDSIVFYDLVHYNKIQVVKDLVGDYPYYRGFCLGSDFVATLATSRNKRALGINVRRVNASTRLYGPDIDMTAVAHFDTEFWNEKFYLDGNFLIVDVFSRDCLTRVIKVFHAATLQQIRERTFRTLVWGMTLKQECHRGHIVVNHVTDDYGGPYLAVWNVEQDTVRPIAQLPPLHTKSCFLYSAAMTHYPNQQFVLRKSYQEEVTLSMFSTEDWRLRRSGSSLRRASSGPGRGSLRRRAGIGGGGGRSSPDGDERSAGEDFPSKKFIPACPTSRVELFNRDVFHFDGAQCIFLTCGVLNFIDFVV